MVGDHMGILGAVVFAPYFFAPTHTIDDSILSTIKPFLVAMGIPPTQFKVLLITGNHTTGLL